MPIDYAWKTVVERVVEHVVVSEPAPTPEPLRMEVPLGLIVMWSGLFTDIPAGWALCDGQKETPDLRDRFVLGASKKAGEPGGSHNKVLVEKNMPPHDHAVGGSTKKQDTSHKHSIGNHEHSYTRLVSKDTQRKKGMMGSESLFVYEPEREQTGPCELTCEAIEASHKHDLPVATSTKGGGEAFDIRPAYYRLAFIMKV